jgi:hypothetical protein
MKRVVPSVYAFMCGNGGFLIEMNEDEQQDFPKELAKAYEERLKEMELLEKTLKEIGNPFASAVFHVIQGLNNMEMLAQTPDEKRLVTEISKSLLMALEYLRSRIAREREGPV